MHFVGANQLQRRVQYVGCASSNQWGYNCDLTDANTCKNRGEWLVAWVRP